MSISVTKLFEASDEAIKNHRWSGRALKNRNKFVNINKSIINDLQVLVFFPLPIYDPPRPFLPSLKDPYLDENVKSSKIFFFESLNVKVAYF